MSHFIIPERSICSTSLTRPTARTKTFIETCIIAPRALRRDHTDLPPTRAVRGMIASAANPVTSDVICRGNAQVELVLADQRGVYVLRARDRSAIALRNVRSFQCICEASIIVPPVPAKNTYGVCGQGERERERERERETKVLQCTERRRWFLIYSDRKEGCQHFKNCKVLLQMQLKNYVFTAVPLLSATKL